MLVIRQDTRVRLRSRNAPTGRSAIPWTAEGGAEEPSEGFVIDGQAVILGVDGISDFNALHSGQYDQEVQL